MLKSPSSPCVPRLCDVDKIVCVFRLFNSRIHSEIFPQKFSTFHHENVDKWMRQMEFIVEVISLTVPLMVASVFRRSSTLRMEVSTVE